MTTINTKLNEEITTLFGFEYAGQFDTAKYSIEELDLSVRSYNCLIRAGIKLQELIQMTEEEISKIRNMGKKSAAEVYAKTEAVRNLALGKKNVYFYKDDITNNYAWLHNGIIEHLDLDDFDDYDDYDDYE